MTEPARALRKSQALLGELLGADNADNSIATTLVAANADGSLLERLEWLQAIQQWASVSGETDIDDSEQTETTPWVLLTIAPAAEIFDCYVDIDLHKATTGYGAVESTATIQFFVARQVDGTNWRRQAANEAALTGTLAANRMQRIPVGPIKANDTVRIYAVLSGDATSDMELPYEVHYRSLSAPTVTPIAAG